MSTPFSSADRTEQGLIKAEERIIDAVNIVFAFADEVFNDDKSILHGSINSIGKTLDIASSSGEFIGVSKVISEDIAEFNEILSELIEENPQNYYDFAYKDLSTIKTIDFVLTNALKWTEIDDHNDWENAQILVNELEK